MPSRLSPAYTRFKASMSLDYGKWRDGEPYDMAALADVTPDERDLLTEEIITRGSLDWRDVEALRALGTPKALARIAAAASEQADGGGAEALIFEVETNGWTAESEARLIAMLADMESMTSASDRLYRLCEQHPTPAVMQRLLRNARAQPDETMRYSAGAMALYLAGHADDWYGFDAAHRPHLLGLNAADDKARHAALAWLEEKVSNPKR